MPRNSTLAILLFIVMCASALLLWAWASRPRAESSELFEAYPAGVVTFNRHVAPIVFANCAPCHRPGEAAPFPLLSYGDVKQRAGQITDVTHRRFMPPWLPKRGLVKFARERILTEQEIDLIRQWAAEGTAEGNPADLPSIPEWTEVGNWASRTWWSRSPRPIRSRPTGRTCIAISLFHLHYPPRAMSGRSSFAPAIDGLCIMPRS